MAKIVPSERLILRQALEEEVTEFLGRERYRRADEGAAIYPNGYEPRTVKPTSGSMELERLRSRDAAELGFESQVLGGASRTHALEAPIIVGFLRGLSVRDVEALLEEALGEQVVGKSTVARIWQDTASGTARSVSGGWTSTISCTGTGRDLPQAAPGRRARRGRPGRLGLTLETGSDHPVHRTGGTPERLCRRRVPPGAPDATRR